MSNQKNLKEVNGNRAHKISGMGDQLTGFAGDMTEAIDALKAQIGKGSGSDLTPQVTTLVALCEKLDTFATKLTEIDKEAE